MSSYQGSQKKAGESGVLSWVLIFICFATIWPLGLFLLIRKLFANSSTAAQKKEIPPLQREKTAQTAGKTTAAAKESASKKTAAKKDTFTKRMVKNPSMKAGTRRTLKIVGAILAIAGAAMAIDTVSWMISYPPVYRWDILELLQQCAILGGGVIMFVKGLLMDRAAARYQKYLAAMQTVHSMSFAQLSSITGYKERRIIKDLERMIEKAYFGENAYLDFGLGYFFRSRSAADAAAKKRAETAKEAAVPKETAQGYSGTLRAIRRANDRIADPVLSEKIDRLEEVTAQIFRAIEKDPRKEKQVHTFLSYYLPTTQKLLDSYAEFEEAGVDGENLRMAKEKIEDTMDNIVRGFENQLDALYAAEAMDIQSDIDVMNHMMRRDGTIGGSDFKVQTGRSVGQENAATAVQTQEE